MKIMIKYQVKKQVKVEMEIQIMFMFKENIYLLILLLPDQFPLIFQIYIK